MDAIKDVASFSCLAITRDDSLKAFAKIPFVYRPDSSTAEVGLLMPRKYWLSKGLMELVRERFWESSERLLPRKKYQTEDFYADPDWPDLKRGYRQRIGRCIRVLADKGVLPIIMTNAGKSGPRVYVLDFTKAPGLVI